MSFGIDLNQLKEFLEPKNPKKLSEFGGVTKVCEALKSNLETGLSFNNADTNHTVVQTSTIVQDLEDKSLDEFKKVHPDDKNASFKERIDFYGTNTLPEPKSKSFLVFVWESLGDKTLIVLVIAAIVEIAIGIYKIIKTKETAGLFDGFAIVVAVLVVVIVTAGNDYRKQSQFRKLNDFSKGLASTKVIRNGQTTQIKNTELLIGDVAIIDTGDVIAADGIFIKGTDLKVDESSLTGESNAMLKDETKDPFLLSGTKVISGVGKMLIVGTGVNSVNGRILMTLNVETEETPLQKKLDGIANQIGKFGLGASVLMVIILLVTYFSVSRNPPEKIVDHMISIFISAVTLIVVAIPEGLPLAVTIALAHATLRMLKDNNLVRHLSACETMGNATTICSDKTGTLTMNQMTVVKGRIFNSEFDNQKRDVFQSSLLSTIPEDDKKQLLTLFGNCINVNSSADETENGEGKINFIGSKTDIALLNLTKLLGFSYKDDRKNANILEILPFSSEKKKMTTTVQYGAGDVCGTLKIPAKEQSEVLIFSKGASEIILSNCNKFVDEQGTLQDLTNAHKEKFVALIENYAKQALRTIAIGFKPLVNYDAKEEKGGEGQIVPEVSYSDPIGEEVPKAEVAKRDLSGEGLILLGIVGIEDPVRDAVPLAVKQCQNAGVVVRMVTGDNKVTARSIAQQCGILTEGGLVMEGPEFRNLSREEMDVVVLRLQVLARSSPLDKQILVNALKRNGETVAVTGDGTNDAPALKSADVGFAMGIAGTEVAKEACDIVLMDDNFASLVKAVIWGRSVYDSVRKFLQFQLTVNVTAVVITVFSSLISTVESVNHEPNSVLSAIQLLWVNLIMDTFAALALATDLPTDELLNRNPAKKSDSLISKEMWKQIVGQAIYQIVICFVVYLKPYSIFPFAKPAVAMSVSEDPFVNTVVFNTFVLCQLFNELNSRSISRDLNIFRGVLRNYTFIVIIFFSLAMQIIIVQVGGKIFHLREGGLDIISWLICLALGFGSIPVGFLIRLIPTRDPSPEEENLKLESEIVNEVEELQRVVIKKIEIQHGKELTSKEIELWRSAINRIAIQLKVVGTFKSDVERESFTEGVYIGAQVAMLVNETEKEEKAGTRKSSVSSMPLGIPSTSHIGINIGDSRGLSSSRDLWKNAGTRVRRETGVIEAFRRARA